MTEKRINLYTYRAGNSVLVNSDIELVTERDSVPITGGTKRFMRLQVIKP